MAVSAAFATVGSADLPSRDLIQYALSFEGISTLIIGIGRVDDDPEKYQLEQNLRAAQVEKKLDAGKMKDIEDRLTALGKQKGNAYFQRLRKSDFFMKISWARMKAAANINTLSGPWTQPAPQPRAL